MKQFMLLMAVIGLAATGCAQNRVFGPHARRGGANLQIAQSKSTPPRSTPRPNFRQAMESEANESTGANDIDLAIFSGNDGCDDTCCGGCDDQCCGECEADCGCPDECCGGGGCCDSGCCDSGSCASGYCGDGGCSSGCGGCSACGGQGCGLCQRVAGRVASGFCPHAAGYPAAYNYNPSPPSGQVAYPYYTVRGPRDFLRNNPPSIGPY